MKGRAIAIGVFVVAVVVGIVFWKTKQGSDSTATKPLTQGSGSQVGRSADTPKGPTDDTEPASVAVTVTDAKGPLANATVRLEPEQGEVVVVKSGADGIARADGLAPGEWSISASAADHEPNAAKPEQLDAGEEAKVAIQLAAGGRKLSGVVTDMSGGGPVAGARIDAARAETGRPGRAVASAITGVDGKYEMTVAEGMVNVAARSQDYAAQSRFVEVGASGAEANFELVPGGLIEGIVLDEKTRQPIPGARVIARADRGGGMRFGGPGAAKLATAQPDGRFRITGLSPGAYNLTARAGQQQTKTPTVVGIGVAEPVSDVELLVGATLVVRGKVVDETNAGVANASVNVFGNGGIDVDGRTNAQGEFELVGMDPGKYMLFARSDDHLPADRVKLVVENKDVDGVIIKVKRGLVLKGHVEPRQLCEVSIEPENTDLRGNPMMFIGSTPTAADGAFEKKPIDPGKYTLEARCESGDSGKATADAAAGMAEITIPVKAGASIAGKVIDKDGNPLAGVTVSASAQGGMEKTIIVNGMLASGVKAFTNGAGQYEIRGLSAGTYGLTVLDRGRPLRPLKQAKAPVATVKDAEKKTGVDVAVDRANGIVEGIVLGPDGQPLADAWVSIHQDLEAMLTGMREGRDGPNDSGGRMIMVQSTNEGDDSGGGFQPTLTGPDGKFRITGLPAGAYEVLAEAQKGTLRGRASNVTPDANLTIRATGLTTLSGTVTGPNGPAALFTVELDGPTRAQRSFTNGTFELGRVDPGNYVVRVTSSDGNAEQKVAVNAGTPTKLDVKLVANAIVVGRLVDGAGKPIGGMPVAIVEDSGDGRIRISMEGPPPTSNPDGTFRVEGKAGTAALVVLGGGGPPTTKRGLVLEPGKTLELGDVKVEARVGGGPGPGGPGPGAPPPSGSGSSERRAGETTNVATARPAQ